MAKRHSLAEDIISGRPAISVVPPAPKPRAAAAAPARLKTVPVRLTEEQHRALVKEAVRRMEKHGGGRLDASEVVRELVDAWMEEG